MMDWKHIVVAQSHYKDLLEEAEHERQVREFRKSSDKNVKQPESTYKSPLHVITGLEYWRKLNPMKAKNKDS